MGRILHDSLSAQTGSVSFSIQVERLATGPARLNPPATTNYFCDVRGYADTIMFSAVIRLFRVLPGIGVGSQQATYTNA
jgi:hypothetical protein